MMRKVYKHLTQRETGDVNLETGTKGTGNNSGLLI